METMTKYQKLFAEPHKGKMWKSHWEEMKICRLWDEKVGTI